MVNWVRYRLTQLFPQTFRRCRLIYETRTQQSVRADFDDWQFLTNVRQLRHPVQMSPLVNRNEFIQTPPRANSSVATNVNRNLFSSPGLGVASPVVRTWGGEETLGLLSLALSAPTENWLASFFDNVPIRPTGEEIEAASEILQEANIQHDEICTICQEHGQSPTATTVTWRCAGRSI